MHRRACAAAEESGALRIVDVADPATPREIGYFIAEPVASRPSPQRNDVDIDDRGLIYLADRDVSSDRHPGTAPVADPLGAGGSA